MHWNDCKQEFERDGSLRDIYVLNTGIDHWQRLIDFLRTAGYDTTFTIDGKRTPLPENVSTVFCRRDEHACLLAVDLGGIRLHCHFFTETEIEFDLDPEEINGPARLGRLFDFMRRAGRLLQKDVILTPENGEEIAIFRYRPAMDRISYHPLGG